LPRPEPVKFLELLNVLPPSVGIERSDARVFAASIDQQVRLSDLPGSLQGFLVLPLGSGHGRATVYSPVFTHLCALRQRRSETRPDDQHDDVECAGRLDRVLEVPRGDHCLEFPEIRLDPKEAHVVLRQSLDGECRDFTYGDDIAGRGKKNPQPLGHRCMYTQIMRTARRPL
jgi:hypothetical protein